MFILSIVLVGAFVFISQRHVLLPKGTSLFIDWTDSHTAVNSDFDDDFNFKNASDDNLTKALAFSAYAATQRCRNPNPSVSIPGHAFKKLPSGFRSVWSRQSEADKAMLIKSIANRVHPDDVNIIPADAPPWKRAIAQPS